MIFWAMGEGMDEFPKSFPLVLYTGGVHIDLVKSILLFSGVSLVSDVLLHVQSNVVSLKMAQP